MHRTKVYSAECVEGYSQKFALPAFSEGPHSCGPMLQVPTEHPVVMSVIDGTFSYTYGVFRMTMTCKRILDARFVFHPR